MSGILPRDENHVTAVGFESSTTSGLILPGKINEATGRILTSMSGGGGSGTVQTVGVAAANGFAGTSDGDPTDPVLTVTTTVTGVVKGNGTAVSAAVAGTDYVAPGAITTSGLTMATARLLGRSTASTGAVEEITVGTGLSLSAGTLSSTVTGTVTTVSVVSANGFAGSVANASTTPAITLTTSVTGILQGNGTAISAATTTGSGSVVLDTSPTLVTPVLGTPASGTLTNCTGLPLSGVVSSTSTALGVGSLELGDASDTTLSRVSAGVIAVEGVTVPTISSTNTLTNKRVTPRTGTVASSATPTINTDNVDFFSITAQTVDITSMTTNLSGTPTDGQKLWIAITGTAARAITWGSSFEASTVALPTTTVSTNRLDVGFVWNTATSKWRCVATA